MKTNPEGRRRPANVRRRELPGKGPARGMEQQVWVKGSLGRRRRAAWSPQDWGWEKSSGLDCSKRQMKRLAGWGGVGTEEVCRLWVRPPRERQKFNTRLGLD